LNTTTKLNAALVQTAVSEQLLKLAAIRGLRALAFLAEPFEDLVSLAAQYSSQARSWVGRLRVSVCSFVLTRT
jgi:hypothetical protein